MNKQYTDLHAKAHRIAYAVSGSTVTRREAFLAYFSVFLPSISYVLPLTTFTKKQCHHIQSTPTQIFLQKAGFLATLCRHVVFGSRASGGLGFRNLYVEQGVLHIIKLFQSLRTPGQTQHLLRIVIDEWQISSGSSLPLLLHPHHPCKHLKGTWLTSTRTFLSFVNASLSITSMYCPRPLCLYNRAIMDCFNTICGLGRKRLMQLNQCRLFLQIHFLSELVNTQGTHRIPSFWTGEITHRPAPPIHRYPRQVSPSLQIWQLWHATIRKCFCHPRSTVLRRSLGLWFPTPYRRFPAVTHHPLRLWHSDASFSNYIKTSINGPVFSFVQCSASLSEHPIPTTILTHHLTTVTTSHNPIPLPAVPIPTNSHVTTFQDLVNTLPPWKHELVPFLESDLFQYWLSIIYSDSYSL